MFDWFKKEKKDNSSDDFKKLLESVKFDIGKAQNSKGDNTFLASISSIEDFSVLSKKLENCSSKLANFNNDTERINWLIHESGLITNISELIAFCHIIGNTTGNSEIIFKLQKVDPKLKSFLNVMRTVGTSMPDSLLSSMFSTIVVGSKSSSVNKEGKSSIINDQMDELESMITKEKGLPEDDIDIDRGDEGQDEDED